MGLVIATLGQGVGLTRPNLGLGLEQLGAMK